MRERERETKIKTEINQSNLLLEREKRSERV